MRSAELAALHTDPWAQDLVDLESLNAEATDAIALAVEELRQGVRRGGNRAATPAMVAAGPAGVGKTHLFARLRKKLGPHAVLVHVRPLVGGEMTPRFLLGQVVQQLGYDSYGLRQIDVMAGVALAIATGDNARFPSACLEQLRGLEAGQRERRIEEAVETLLARHQELDASYLERLLHVPFASELTRRAALVWLGGREPDEAQAARLGVRDALPDDAVVPAMRTIAVVSSLAAPLLVVFDQLENLVDGGGTQGRIFAYGNLIAELVDVVRDLVIVQMGLNTEWERALEPALSTSQRSRVAGRRLTLALPTKAQGVELLKLWAARVPDPEAPFPWPFTQAQLDAVCGAVGTTPRMLLLELRRALDGEAPLATASQPPPAPRAGDGDVDDAMQGHWEARLDAARRELDEMALAKQGPAWQFLRDGVAYLGQLVDGLGAVKVEQREVIELEGGRGTRFVALVHHSNNSSVRSCFGRLEKLPGRVLAMREQWREWPPTWKATRAEWDSLRRQPHVRWLWLTREDAARLLALASLLKLARSADLIGPDGRPIATEAAVAWVRRALEPDKWTVSRAILGEDAAQEATEAPGPGSHPATAEPTPAPAPEGKARREAAALLQELRVASLERLMRELSSGGVRVSRAAVRAELKRHPAVKWLGDAITYWEE